MDVRWVDERGWGFGWLVDEPHARTSHALVADGGVWLVDAVDVPGLEERVRAVGEPRGVIQLLDRHDRDGAELARRLDVELLEVPRQPLGPFRFVSVRDGRWWREVALWWEERRVLVCADALGTLPYFHARGERLGVHPWLWLAPPRSLQTVVPEHVLVGHGEGVHEGAAEALQRALSGSRRRAPRAALNAVRYFAGGAKRR